MSVDNGEGEFTGVFTGNLTSDTCSPPDSESI